MHQNSAPVIGGGAPGLSVPTAPPPSLRGPGQVLDAALAPAPVIGGGGIVLPNPAPAPPQAPGADEPAGQ